MAQFIFLHNDWYNIRRAGHIFLGKPDQYVNKYTIVRLIWTFAVLSTFSIKLKSPFVRFVKPPHKIIRLIEFICFFSNKYS